VYHAAAARDALAPAPIDVVDSFQLGIGMWPAVIEAARLAHQGASLEEVHVRAMAVLARTHAFVLVESLEPLRRSGRIGRVQELLGTLVDARPILTLNQGEAQLVETVRGRRHAVLRLRDVALSLGEVETLLICGTSIESIWELETVLAEQYRGGIQKTWLGPSIGANLGSASAVAVVVRE
jgi:DegV family protein with EDD domain